MILFFLLLFCCRASAVIYQLNGSEYARMPPVYHLDPYELCLEQNGGMYCTIDIDLVADTESDLLNMIREYSKRVETHFNHTRLRHGICITNMCSDYLKHNTTEDLKVGIEKCLNNSFWKRYQLKTRINEDISCNGGEEKFVLGYDDIAVALVCLCFVLITISGSIYDFLIRKENAKGNKWLLCFSLKQNWCNLTASSRKDGELRIKRLKGLNGMRVIITFLVILEHSLLPFMLYAENMHELESSYDNILYHLFIDGTILVQTFFTISGCLLAYYLQVIAEKQSVSWTMLPKGILLRWLRLTPPYVVILAISMTLVRFTGSGPFWHKIMDTEVQDCRLNGWMNLLYINNYYDKTQCMVHTWYLASDFQLSILGLFVLILAKSNGARKVVLPVLLIVSLILPALHTYYQNLYAYLIVTPEFGRALFRNNATFNNKYKRGHTNMTCYTIGLCLGLVIYHFQKNHFDIEKYRKLKYLYWAIVPVSLPVIIFSSLFYAEGIMIPQIIKVIYSSVLRLIVGLLVSSLILGMVFKLENVYRSILEWHGWSTPARVSYAAYIIHLMIIHVLLGSRTTLVHASSLRVLLLSAGTCCVTFLIAVPFWLVVEAPLTQFFKLILPSGKRDKMETNAENGVDSKL